MIANTGGKSRGQTPPYTAKYSVEGINIFFNHIDNYEPKSGVDTYFKVKLFIGFDPIIDDEGKEC